MQTLNTVLGKIFDFAKYKTHRWQQAKHSKSFCGEGFREYFCTRKFMKLKKAETNVVENEIKKSLLASLVWPVPPSRWWGGSGLLPLKSSCTTPLLNGGLQIGRMSE